MPHGVRTLPWQPAKLPATAPGGLAWPRVCVLTVAGPDGVAPDTRSSVAAQGYPGLDHIIEPGGDDAAGAWGRALVRAEGAHTFVLASGDMLAPGAIAAACLAAILEGAQIVAGLRVVFDDQGVRYLDVVDHPAGPLGGGDWPLAEPALHAPSCRTQRAGARLAVIGRPLVLHRRTDGVADPAPHRLSIVAVAEAGAGGGAAIAHRRLVDALRWAGHHVDTRALPRPSPATAEWIDGFPALEAEIAAGGYDLLLAGNIHGATRSADVLARLHRTVPVAAVTHDMFLLTGRCDVPLDCKLIHDRCTAACPTADSYPYLAPDRIAAAWQGKRAFLGSTPPPLLLANSDWTAAFAKTVLGPALAPIVRRIDLAFPTQVFRPQDRRTVRQRLGLPPDEVLILFAAAVSDNPQKGLADVLSALRGLARPGLGFVVLGRLDDPAALRLAPLHAPGVIADEAVLADWFAACDLHVTASRFESLGQTPIEAGLCGTPSVAYRRTGLSTAIIDGVSGDLVDPEPAALAAALARLVHDAGRRADLGMLGRIALESRNSHAASYLSLLHALRGHGLVPLAAPGGRVWFDPAILSAFDFAADPRPGSAGLPAPPPGRMTRTLRRVKHAIWGRRLPLWQRRALWVIRRIGR